jgi:hypothetical protein
VVPHKETLTHKQPHGTDFDETFTPIIKWGLIRPMISIAAHHGWGRHQLDVKMVFLNGNLKEEVYIWHPQGFSKPWKENMVCKLNKVFYGLK